LGLLSVSWLVFGRFGGLTGFGGRVEEAAAGVLDTDMQIDTKDNIAKLEYEGFCVLNGVFSRPLIDAAREAF
jgi:hypothetical protein